VAHVPERGMRRFDDRFHKIAVCERFLGEHLFGLQPTIPTMAGQIDAEPRETAPYPAVMTVLNAGEVFGHVGRLPRPILRLHCDRIPIRIVRRNKYQCIMRRAPAQAGSARVQHAVYSPAIPRLTIRRIASLLLVIGVMTYEEMPADRVVLGGEGMKSRNVIVIRQSVAIRLNRIAAHKAARIVAGFEQHDALTCLGQASRDRAAACARTDNDVIAVGVLHRLRPKRS
jgi:hypothetical protein